MSDLFVSYKSEDRDRVAPLVAALKAAGVALWWDAHLGGGSAWRETIEAELNAARCVLVVWSARSTGPEGRFVRDEASRALQRGVYLPVQIDSVTLPLGFGEVQALPLTGWKGNAADRRCTDVVAAVRAMIAGAPQPMPAPRLVRSGRRRPIAVVAATLAGCAVIAAVASSTVRCTVTGWHCATASTAPPNSIAVLPFANLSGDAQQEYFSDGLSEELQSALSRLGALQVAARTSSFRFKHSADQSSVIGAKLGVTYLLDGSVRRSGPTVRVSAQLVEAASGFERWTQTYDRQFTDILTVQSGIAEAVADALKVKLIGGVAVLSRGGTHSPVAYDAYLRGRRLFDAGADAVGFRDALARFDAAVAADPGFAVAHAARARTLLAIGNQFSNNATQQRDANAAALVAAQRAVELSPDLAEAQTTLAGVIVNTTLDVGAARRAYAIALRTGAGQADVLVRYGLFSCGIGDVAAGLAAVQHAVVLDPLNPRVYKSLGFALVTAQRYPEAIVQLRHALVLSPGTTSAHASVGDALLLQGDLAGAAAEYALEPTGWDRLRGLAIVRHAQGDAAGARAALAGLMADGADTSRYQQAQIFAQWGDVARAAAALDAAFDLRDPGVLLMATDPLLVPMHDNLAYRRGLARLGVAARVG